MKLNVLEQHSLACFLAIQADEANITGIKASDPIIARGVVDGDACWDEAFAGLAA
jgi:hypothetical protein